MYEISYRGSSELDDVDLVFGILGTILHWVDSNQADYSRVYDSIGHANDGMEIGFRVRDVPNTVTPDEIYVVIRDLIENEINTPNDTEFPVPPDGTQIRDQR